MSEQLPVTSDKASSISNTNKAVYKEYKDSVDLAEKRTAWLEDKSFKGIVKRAVNTTVKTLLVQSPDMKTYEDLNAPYDAADYAKHHLKENEEAVKLDAVHDATAAGMELNLPDGGLPETVTNVQPLPAQEQKRS